MRQHFALFECHHGRVQSCELSGVRVLLPPLTPGIHEGSCAQHWRQGALRGRVMRLRRQMKEADEGPVFGAELEARTLTGHLTDFVLILRTKDIL